MRFHASKDLIVAYYPPGGTHISQAAALAAKLGFQYLAFNGLLYYRAGDKFCCSFNNKSIPIPENQDD